VCDAAFDAVAAPRKITIPTDAAMSAISEDADTLERRPSLFFDMYLVPFDPWRPNDTSFS
jgi:hypothetical protein